MVIADSRQFRTRTRQQLLSLKAKIKGLAEESSRLRKFIYNSSGPKRDYYWEIKRSIGKEARYHLLAYGLLRGIPYKEIEPNSNKYLRNLLNYEYLASICKHHYGFSSIWTAKNVKSLIEKGTIPPKEKLWKTMRL